MHINMEVPPQHIHHGPQQGAQPAVKDTVCSTGQTEWAVTAATNARSGVVFWRREGTGEPRNMLSNKKGERLAAITGLAKRNKE